MRLAYQFLLTILAVLFNFAILQLPAALAAEEAVKIVAAQPLDPAESLGERPYEMVWANREPPHTPLVHFDSLEGWTLECEKGAEGKLIGSNKQRVWESPTARMIYRGDSPDSAVTLRPPAPMDIGDPVSAATVWIYGNNWGWVPDPTTPQVNVDLLLQDGEGKAHNLEITRVRWKEWWLAHKILPQELQAKLPLKLLGIKVRGCANKEDRELFFEDICFYKESLEPIAFAPRPQRGIDPFPGQSAGANTGPGRLPFPTREETILPENGVEKFKTQMLFSKDMKRFRAIYSATDIVLEFCWSPGEAYWGPIQAKMNRIPVADILAEAGPVFSEKLKDMHLTQCEMKDETAHAEWKGKLGDKEIAVESSIRLWQKSLVVDFICRGGDAVELSYGKFLNVREPELMQLPFMNYGGHHLNVLMSHGIEPFFASVWMDWYRSNASAPYAADKIENGEIFLNGGVRYQPKTDGKRNDMYERFFVTLAPTFEETLATIPNTPAVEGEIAGTRLWQESWGPGDYEKEHQRCLTLRAYGIEMLTQCNHEITWRNEGESFTFRTKASPAKGGDEALQKYVAAQKSLGWRSGLYTNYCDFSPVNSYWNIDRVMRHSSGDLVTAWPRCYSPKALYAVEMDRELAPAIHEKYQSDAAYTDVHTSVSPWDRTDYDARVPGAGTFAATFYAYGELLLNDQQVYDHHCWSEGNHQWLYAGLCTGNYGLAYSGLKLWRYPYLPHFDLLKMHSLSVDIGMPWTAYFFDQKEGWDKPENIDGSIDQFIAATIAYGHIGWLVEESHGIRRACRSYYTMQPLQSRYVMKKPQAIRYGTDAGTISSSEAFLNGEWKQSRLVVRYPGGLEIWVNGHADKPWRVTQGEDVHELPPYGWLAVQGGDFYVASELVEGSRCDRVLSPEFIFIDGRGVERVFGGVGVSGCAAVRKAKDGEGLSIIAVEGVDRIKIVSPGGEYGAADVRARIASAAKAKTFSATAWDVNGENLGEAKAESSKEGWTISAKGKAIRYELNWKE
ncbi:MAG: hypothetical protein AB1656_15420 [Candidatus Omnitrophota bacterium]